MNFFYKISIYKNTKLLLETMFYSKHFPIKNSTIRE